MGHVSTTTKGILAVITAAVIWGIMPVYYDLLNAVPPADILMHRITWSLVFFTIVLAFRGRLPALGEAVTDRSQVGWIALSAIFISFNWFFFIYSIQVSRLTEASLGYYMYPLVSVLLGFLIFRERLTRLQVIAVALMALAVAILTFGLGVLPSISLVLAVTFSAYGVVKKKVATGPTVSVTAEVLILFPLVMLGFLMFADASILTPKLWVLLILSGPLTGLPLILFSYAAQRVRLSTVGLISYLNPTLQFLVAALIFVEPLTQWHAIALLLIWIALIFYSVVAVRQDRFRAATRSSTSGTA